ncbi:hypothetical protein JCM10212_000926 [Sporobolomyces blumeae]
MGRSAKFAKRPTKAEKVARTINKPEQPTSRAQRSLSPDEGPRSAIPLFNTSAKGRAPTKPDPRIKPGLDAMLDDGEVEPDADLEGEDAGDDLKPKKKRNLKDKLKAAKESLDKDEQRHDQKLGAKYKKGGKPHVLGGKDYVKMLESRPGGAFKHKKLR